MNPFFQYALRKASGMAGQKTRIFQVLGKLGSRLIQMDWRKINADGAKEKFALLGRLTKAYVQGQYRNVPWKTIAIVLAAILYFLNPLDLIPDVLAGVGFTDDLAVLAMVFNSLERELEAFRQWEKSNRHSDISMEN